MFLTSREIIRHLELALECSENNLQEKVEHIVTLAKRHTKLPAVPMRNALFANGKTATREYWDVQLNRTDAKFVEEVWADFMSRKRLHGTWRTATKKGRLSPVARDIDTGVITFRFFKVPDAIRIPKEKVEAKPSLENTTAAVDKMPDAQKLELLKILLARKPK